MRKYNAFAKVEAVVSEPAMMISRLSSSNAWRPGGAEGSF